MTCSPYVFNIPLPLFPLFPLPSIPCPFVSTCRGPISLLDSDQASDLYSLQDSIANSPTGTFQAGHSIYHTLPRQFTCMFSIINNQLLEVKDNICYALLGSWPTFPCPEPVSLKKSTFDIAPPPGKALSSLTLLLLNFLK